MSDPSATSSQPMLPGMTNATSSPASAAGRSPSNSPAGKANAGQVPAPASLFHRPANAEALMTSGISGLFSHGSSGTVALQQSLENRLLQRMDAFGSLEYELTWKRWNIKSGPPICALRASAAQTSGNGSIGWPTATRNDEKNAPYQVSGGKRYPTLPGAALSAGWPTPNVPNGGRQPKGGMTSTGMTPDGKKRQVGLEQIAKLAGWTTPQAHDQTARGKGQKVRHGTKHGCADLNSDAALVGWATPLSRDSRSEEMRPEYLKKRWEHPRGKPLSLEAKLSGWRSPDHNSRGGAYSDPKKALKRIKSGHQVNLEDEVIGLTQSLSHAPTAPKGVLDASFSRWLMGYPETWDKASQHYDDWQKAQEEIASGGSKATATPSSRRSRRSS